MCPLELFQTRRLRLTHSRRVKRNFVPARELPWDEEVTPHRHVETSNVSLFRGATVPRHLVSVSTYRQRLRTWGSVPWLPLFFFLPCHEDVARRTGETMKIETKHYLHVTGTTWQGTKEQRTYETEAIPMTRAEALEITQLDFAELDTVELETRALCSVKFEIRA